MRDLLAGHIDAIFDNPRNALPHISHGNVKALAVTGPTRIPELPDVPAIAETVSRLRSTDWFAMVAPPKTPPEIATQLSQAIAEALKLPDVVERYRAIASTPVGSSPAETGGLPEARIRALAAGDRGRRDQDRSCVK